MSVMEARLGGRRVAARNAAERRKKFVLVGLIVLFVALMAFQLPRMLKGSESSATAPVAVSAVPATAGGGSGPAVTSAPVGSSARVRAIRRMPAKDPFVPLIRDNATTASAAPAAPTTSSPRVRLAVRAAVPTPVAPRRAVVRAVKPTAAVLLVNGRRQVVGVHEAFGFGDATFRVVSVGRKAMRLQVSGGSFGAGRQTITVRKGHRVNLVNTATGESFSIRFSAPTTKS
jgi:hypothetical protein